MSLQAQKNLWPFNAKKPFSELKTRKSMRIRLLQLMVVFTGNEVLQNTNSVSKKSCCIVNKYTC